MPSLQKAISQADMPAVQAALANRADIEEFPKDEQTPLMLATSSRQNEAIELLVSSGSNINATCPRGWTALMYAVRQNDLETVQQLISLGADVNHLSPDCWTALVEAAYRGLKPVMKILLHRWAKSPIRAPLGEGGEQATDRAVGEPENRAHAQGWTPSMLASQGGHEELAAMLLQLGVNVWFRSPHDKTALELARENGWKETEQILADAEDSS